MSKVFIVYWSGSGNTEKMAEAVRDGAVKAGAEAALLDVSKASVEELKEAKAFALGCPAMGDEVLEEGEMEPFVSELEGAVNGKKIGLFGSYGWGDGQWMRDWEERMKQAGAEIVNGTGVIANDAPDDDAVSECEALGEALAGAVK